MLSNHEILFDFSILVRQKTHLTKFSRTSKKKKKKKICSGMSFIAPRGKFNVDLEKFLVYSMQYLTLFYKNVTCTLCELGSSIMMTFLSILIIKTNTGTNNSNKYNLCTSSASVTTRLNRYLLEGRVTQTVLRASF
uniref:Uncharacterized protein n=1 Tax=Cacopsylla melanoneura TaxID=428564 RepID=A0A8D8SPW7_9HEMI